VVEDLSPSQVADEISKINWIFARDGDDFKKAWQAIISAVNSDPDHTYIPLPTTEFDSI
jgi:hypothetical protein